MAKLSGALTILVSLGCCISQTVISPKAGLISYSQGEVFLDDRRLEPGFAHPRQVPEHSLLRSSRGRAELLLGPCVVLHMDETTSLRLVSTQLSDTRVELLSGAIDLVADGNLKGSITRISTGPAIVTVNRAGKYRLDADPPTLRVFHGKATVKRTSDELISVPKGWLLPLGNSGRAIKFDSQIADALDMWSEARIASLVKANKSALMQASRQTESEAPPQQSAETGVRTGGRRESMESPTESHANADRAGVPPQGLPPNPSGDIQGCFVSAK